MLTEYFFMNNFPFKSGVIIWCFIQAIIIGFQRFPSDYVSS